MTEWIEDLRGRPELTDPETGTRYRLEGSPNRHDNSVQLAVYLDGSGHSYDRTVFPDADAAKEHTVRRMQHDREERALNRRKSHSTVKTPWGRAKSCTTYVDGLSLYSTSQTDAFNLSADLNARVPARLRHADGWYQEDPDGFRVVLAHPDAFTGMEIEEATKTARELFPDELESFEDLQATVPGL